MAITSPPNIPEEQEESFFVSMTDMMVGMLFLFIIMLMFFAMKFSDDSVDLRDQILQAEKEKEKLKEQLTLLQGAESTKSRIVREVGRTLKDKGVDVSIDADNGLLHLPESILFEIGRSELSENGKNAVKELSSALFTVLPCYTTQAGIPKREDCPPTVFGVDALLIEGHADTDGSKDMNWRLSMERALRTYQILVKEQPQLDAMCSRQRGEDQNYYPILSTAGYGYNRPLARLPDESEKDHKQRNRRIDIRFIITPPDIKNLDTARRAIQ